MHKRQCQVCYGPTSATLPLKRQVHVGGMKKGPTKDPFSTLPVGLADLFIGSEVMREERGGQQ